jgi:stage V sporulation protein B
VLLLAYTDLSLYALAIAMVVYSFLMCLLNNIAVRKALSYRQEMVKTFLKPALSAAVMGVAAFYVYKVIYMLVPINLVALLPAIFVAVILYFTLVIKTGALSEEELTHIPKGGMIVRMAKKLHLL